jgi:hypothetical protein
MIIARFNIPVELRVVLLDDITNKLSFVRDLSVVIQFELDKPFQNYQPHYHYTVTV